MRGFNQGRGGWRDRNPDFMGGQPYRAGWRGRGSGYRGRGRGYSRDGWNPTDPPDHPNRNSSWRDNSYQRDDSRENFNSRTRDNWRSESSRGTRPWRERPGSQRSFDEGGMRSNYNEFESQRGRGGGPVSHPRGARGHRNMRQPDANRGHRGRGGNSASANDFFRVTRVGYRGLNFDELEEMDPHERLVAITGKHSKFLAALNQTGDSEDEINQIPSLMKLLAGVTKCTHSNQVLNGLLVDSLGTHFFSQRINSLVNNGIVDIVLNNKWSSNDVRMCVTSILEIMVAMFNRLENMAFDKLHLAVTGIEGLLKSLKEMQSEEEMVDQTLFDLLKELMQLDASVSEKKVANLKLKNSNPQEPPDNFRDYPVIPGRKDLECEKAFIRKNVVTGNYRSVDDYLDTQFRLMREDFISPLRKGYQEFLSMDADLSKRKRISEVRIYRGTQVLEPQCLKNGIGHVVKIDTTRYLRNVQWERSKRLMFGSLLLFLSDDSDDILFATVVDREVQRLRGRSELVVRFLNQNLNSIQRGCKFIMIESTAYFEAYKHILKRLKEFEETNIPFPEHLVDCLSVVQPPDYLASNLTRQYDFTCLLTKDRKNSKSSYEVNPLSINHWPTKDDLGLDESQYKALKNSITRRVALVQGPPGTGKTFIGLRIAQLLLENIVNPSDGEFGPILLVCFTNHALDQFLEGIAEFKKDKIVRVGGQSRNESLKCYALAEIRIRFIREKRFPPQIQQNIGTYKERIELLKNHVMRAYAHLNASSNYILKLQSMKDDMSPRHLHAIIGDATDVSEEQHFNDWLLKLPKKKAPTQETGVSEVIEEILFEVVFEELHALIDEGDAESGEEDAEADAEVDVEDEAAFEAGQRGLEEDQENLNVGPQMEERVRALIGQAFMDIAHDDRMSHLSRFQLQRAIDKELQKTDYMTDEEEDLVVHPSSLAWRDKWRLYRLWRNRYQTRLSQAVEELSVRYNESCERLAEWEAHSDREVMKAQDVIAMTTTGAARYGHMLSIIKPKIIIVEEAAEVFESHVVSSLSEGCQHLILIGDHKQLRPSPAVYDLAKRYNLEISLFERMINNKFQFDTLALQHRMRPEISNLVRNSGIYPELGDHESVLNYPQVVGVAHNVFFIDHKNMENEADDLQSYSNTFEAKYVVRLCRHFILQGYRPERITILTLYTGQLFHIKKFIVGREFGGLKVTVVDNYQGEENDIIILSLVRSNFEERIGFVGVDNRICVALSRARMGLYVLGNFDLFTRKSKLWSNVVKLVRETGQIGTGLVLACPQHPSEDRKIARVPEDFDKYAPKGGCDVECGARLSCGHLCRKKCHPVDREHKNSRCERECGRLCSRGEHACKKPCHMECGKCNQTIDLTLDCGHTVTVICSKESEEIKCGLKCDHRLPCGHQCTNGCGEPHTENCKVKVDKVSPFCGHTVNTECWHPMTDLRCSEPCREKLLCGHECRGNCWDCNEGRLHIPCKNPCDRLLVCGHKCRLPCMKECQPCSVSHEVKCDHGGGLDIHGVNDLKKCRQKCTNKCSHKVCNALCHKLCDKDPCDLPCQETFRCRKCNKNVQCPGLCGEKCIRLCRNCDAARIVTDVMFAKEGESAELFLRLEHCGHIFEVTSLDKAIKDNEDGLFTTIRCPECRTLITPTSCKRYLNEIKKRGANFSSVAQKIQMEERNFAAERTIIQNKVILLQLPKLSELLGVDSLIQNFIKRFREIKKSDEILLCKSILEIVTNLESSIAKYKSISEDDGGPQAWVDRLRHNVRGITDCVDKSTVSWDQLTQCSMETSRIENFVIVFDLLSKCTKEDQKNQLDEIWTACEKYCTSNKGAQNDVHELLQNFRSKNSFYGSQISTKTPTVFLPLKFTANEWRLSSSGEVKSLRDMGIRAV